MNKLFETPSRAAVILLLLGAIATLTAAWAFQLIGGYAPCKLCLQQRWSWYAVIPLCAVLLMIDRNAQRNTLVTAGLVLAAVILLAGASIGVYQAGAEWKFWEGPSSCSGGGGLSGILPDLDRVQVIRCDEASWRFLGLSFAGWNVVLSVIVAGIGLWGALPKRPSTMVHGSSSVSQ